MSESYLKSCYACQNKVSTDAEICPHCGARLRSSWRFEVATVLSGVVFFVAVVVIMASLAAGKADMVFPALVVLLISLAIFGRR